MLIKGISEIKLIIPVSLSSDFQRIKPFIEESERVFIKPILGLPFYTALDNYYNAVAPTPDANYDLLKPYLHRPITYLAYWIGYDTLSLKFSDAGIHRVEKDGLTAPFLRQEKAIKKQFKTTGYNQIDELFDFLHLNILNYPLFTEPERNLIVNNAKEFNEIFDIQNSHDLFLKTVKYQKLVEDFTIIPVIGKELYTQIKSEIKSSSLTAANKILFDELKKAVVFMTLARGSYDLLLMIYEKSFATESKIASGNNEDMQAVSLEYMDNVIENFESTGAAYIRAIQLLLNKNLTDYPLYANSSAYHENLVIGKNFNSSHTKIRII